MSFSHRLKIGNKFLVCSNNAFAPIQLVCQNSVLEFYHNSGVEIGDCPLIVEDYNK